MSLVDGPAHIESSPTSTGSPAGLGLTDLPTGEDALGIEPYADALTDFVLGCPTPMTIAVQGDWGSGKTSTLQMVEQRLRDRGGAICVEFNTWQYSQFDLGPDLVAHLVQSIIDQVDPDDAGEERSRASEFLTVLKAAGTGAMDAALASAASKMGGDVGRAAYDGAKRGFFKRTQGEAAPIDVVAALVGLRSAFQVLVERRMARSGAARVVIFIDDLDRLPPARSIEVMEGLKTLLDCTGCVFVLAIDFDIVLRGVRQKYDADLPEEKARAYFDKMIQLPFQMPTASYTIERLLTADLERLGVTGGDMALMTRLVKTSIGTNPRALKRLLNTFSLLRRLTRPDTTDGADPSSADLRLFALLALQVGYPILHESVALTPAPGLAALLAEVREAAASEDPERVAGWTGTQTPGRLVAFIDALERTLGGSGRDESLGEALTLTRITAVQRTSPPVGRVSAATEMDLEDRERRLTSYGIDSSLVSWAGGLERTLGQRLEQEGLPFAAAEMAKGTMWAWYATPPSASGRRRTFCEVYFTKQGTLNLYFGQAWSADETDPVAVEAAGLAAAHGWQFKVGASGNRLRLYGLGANDPVEHLVELLLTCHRRATDH